MGSLLKADVNIKVVSERRGHASTAFRLEFDGNVIEGTQLIELSLHSSRRSQKPASKRLAKYKH